jgi:cytochrome bd-type quinol oxidase subunit 2
MEPKARRFRWLSLVAVPLVASGAYAILLDRTTEPGCSGHNWTIQWIWPLIGVAAAVAAALAIRAGERATVVVGRAFVTLILSTGGLFVVFLYWGAAHGCWS